MKISLVIPAYNEEKCIGTCLEYAVKNSAIGGFCEIIVIDNASTDGTAAIVRQYTARNPQANIRVVTESQKGLTKARQRGLQEAIGDYLAFIDADTQMPPQWLEKAQKILSQNKDGNSGNDTSRKTIVSLSGPYKYYDGTALVRFVMAFFWTVTTPIARLIAGYALLGGNFIAKKSALEAMGGFNTSIAFYGEDTDIARRLSKFGKVIFRQDFFIYSSARRLMSEGLIRANATYALNFIWPVVFGRPFTKKYKDIRI